jgi:hypothetical protein
LMINSLNLCFGMNYQLNVLDHYINHHHDSPLAS